MYSIDGVPLDELERRMRPSGWTVEGFLTQGQSLIRIIADDKITMYKLGVTAQQIASTLEFLLEKGAQSDRFRPAKVGRFLVRINRTHKMRTCPWAPKQFDWCRVGIGAKHLSTNDFEITNIQTGNKLTGTSLCVHLIRDHGFFGGPDTAYRIDPAKAVHVLEMESDLKRK